jgi:hypothetical protein
MNLFFSGHEHSWKFESTRVIAASGQEINSLTRAADPQLCPAVQGPIASVVAIEFVFSGQRALLDAANLNPLDSCSFNEHGKPFSFFFVHAAPLKKLLGGFNRYQLGSIFGSLPCSSGARAASLMPSRRWC